MLKQRPFLIETLTAIGLLVAPFVLPHLGFAPNTVNRILVWGLFGLGFDILFGFTGLLSFGQSAFYGTGGFVAAYLLTRAGFPNVMLALVIGMIAAAVVGYLVGLIALRRTGIYFAMITVAIAEVFFFVEFNPLSAWTGGENGLPGVPTPSFDLGLRQFHFTTGWSLYQFLALCYFVGVVIALRIVRSPVGAILSAIRDNPLRATAVGHNIHAYKLTAFVIAAAYAGFAGGLLGVLQAFMPPDAFTFDTSGQLVMQTAIGGRGTLVRSAGRRRGLAVPAGFPAGGAWAWRGVEARARRHLRAAGLLPAPRHYRRHRGSLRPDHRQERETRRAEVATAVAPVAEAAKAMEAGSPPQTPKPAARSRRPFRPDPAGNRPDQALWRPGRQQRYRFHGQSRRTARHHRSERRRQIDLLQDADLRGPSDVGHDHVRGAGYHRHQRHRCLPARPDQELSGQPALHGLDGARERRDRGAGQIARQIPPRSVPQPRQHPGI